MREWQVLQERFPAPFDGVIRPMVGGLLKIKLFEGFRPRQCYFMRPVPIMLLDPLRAELREQEQMNIIEPADDYNDPAETLNPMVVVWKKDGKKVRLTVDLRELNKGTVRPVHVSVPPGKVVARINPKAAIFTVLDGYKGFHQIELHPDSRKLTTFVTPLGRYRYKRMPMGWSGSSDVFGYRMDKALAGIPHVHRVVEDILIATTTWEEHLQTLEKVLSACVTNNR